MHDAHTIATPKTWALPGTPHNLPVRIVPAHRDTTQGALAGIIINAQASITGVHHQRRPLVQRIANGLGDGTSGQDLCLLLDEPQADLLQDRRGLRLAQKRAKRGCPLLAIAVGTSLSTAIQPADHLQHPQGSRRVRFLGVEVFPPMCAQQATSITSPRAYSLS